MNENDKPKKPRVGGVEKTLKSTAISRVDALEKVEKVQKTAGVEKSRAASIEGGFAPPMSLADREKLFGIVNEEAEKLFSKSRLPEKQKKLIREAVKMAIDSSLIPDTPAEGEE